MLLSTLRDCQSPHCVRWVQADLHHAIPVSLGEIDGLLARDVPAVIARLLRLVVAVQYSLLVQALTAADALILGLRKRHTIPIPERVGNAN